MMSENNLLSQVAQYVHFDAESCPSIILSISPCRSGSTILLRVFGANGVQAHFQQLKNILRWSLEGTAFEWNIPQTQTAKLFLKETLGPFTLIESQFNPLATLLAAGFPKHKLKVLILGRNPTSVWASWVHYWKHKTHVEFFIETYKTVESINRLAMQEGIDCVRLNYDCFADAQPDAIFAKLFEKLGLDQFSLSLSGWDKHPIFGTEQSNIVLPKEPIAFVTPGIHDAVEQASCFSYHPKPVDISQLDVEDLAKINTSEVFEIYQHWQQQCNADLALA